MTLTLHHWPLQERPRERLLKHGPQQLSDTELLAIILRSGTRGLTVLELAGTLLTHFSSLRGVISASSHELCAVPGIGKARYCELQAAMEICRRQLAEPLYKRSVFHCAEDAKYYLRAELRDLKQEVFGVLMLDSQRASAQSVCLVPCLCRNLRARVAVREPPRWRAEGQREALREGVGRHEIPYV